MLGRAAGELAVPERDLQFQPADRVVDAVADQPVDLVHAVADRLRVHVQAGRDLVDATAGVQPGEQRRGQPLALLRRQAGERGEAASAQLVEQELVGVHQQGEQMVVAADDRAVDHAALREADRPPGQGQRLPGLGQRHGRPDG